MCACMHIRVRVPFPVYASTIIIVVFLLQTALAPFYAAVRRSTSSKFFFFFVFCVCVCVCVCVCELPI